jgi:hypothetical protein
MLLDLAEALQIPFRERNGLLLAGGFAPIYSEAKWDDAEMSSITTAVRRMLRQHEPYPAVLMDRYWNVLDSNEASPRFFGSFIDIHGLQARTGMRNLLHLMFDPGGMRPFIHDWRNVAHSLLQRVRREAVGGVRDDRTEELVAALLSYSNEKTEKPSERYDRDAELPMIPLAFARDGVVLRYFSMVSTVGTPQTIASQELRVECMFPADDMTESHHLALMQRAENGENDH